MKKDFIYKNKYDLIAATNDLYELLLNKEKPIFIGLDKYDTSERITTNYSNTISEFNSIGICTNINIDDLTADAYMEFSEFTYSPDLYCITVHVNSSEGIANSVSLYLTRKYINGISIIDETKAPADLFHKYPLSYLKYKPFNVITLCGSTRFKNDFIEAEELLTLSGNIVIPLSIFNHSNGKSLSEQELLLLERMHRQKIDMSNEIMVIDTDGYVGYSTSQEIAYAKNTGKRVSYWSEYFKEIKNKNK